MRKAETVVIVVSALLALPFGLVWPWMALFRLLVEWFPSASPLFALGLPGDLFFLFLSSMPRYLGLNLAALLLSSAGLLLVWRHERGRAWRRARFYLPLLGLASVLVFPLLARYRPAARPAPGVELVHVDPPGLLVGAVKACQTGAEVSAYQYEPLGWADAQTLVYQRWQGGGHYDGAWSPGTPRGPFAYDLETGATAPFTGDLAEIVHRSCSRASCVEPGLFAGSLLALPSRYDTPLLSPDGRWVAFTARHAHGPEDLFVIALGARQAAAAQPTPTPAPAVESIHTPEELRQHIAAWPAAFKVVVDEDVVIRFAYPHPIIDWVGSAFIDHIPSMSHVIFDYQGQISRTRYESSEGQARLEALLQDQALVDRVRQGIQEARERANVMMSLPITQLPADVADLPRQALDTQVRPLDLHGREYVGLQAGQVDVIDLDTGEKTRVAEGSGHKGGPALSEQYVAWIVSAGEMTVRFKGEEMHWSLSHIVVRDRRTGEEKQITREPMPRTGLALDGHRLVWMDKRNELQDDPLHYDLYAYDLLADVEIPVAVAPGAQLTPRIHGDLVVWADNRNSPHLGTPLAGCGNCPENRFDIYAYDFATRTEQAIAEDEWNNANPTVYGRQVAWVTWHEHRRSELRLFDLDTRAHYRVTASPDPVRDPVLSGDRLLWTVTSDCDVNDVEIGPDGQKIVPPVGVYMLDLRSGRLLRLTDYKEARALFDRGTVIVTESCWEIRDVYAIALD